MKLFLAESFIGDVIINTYPEGSYVKTLGFKEPGDGGAAVYIVTTSAVDNGTVDVAYGDVALSFSNGDFYKTTVNEDGSKVYTKYSLIFEHKVTAEQFGVCAVESTAQDEITVDYNLTIAQQNSELLHHMLAFFPAKGLMLEFAKDKTYYVGKNMGLKSNTVINGNGAVLQLYRTSAGDVYMFNSSGTIKNIYINSLNFVGRAALEDIYGGPENAIDFYSDQCIKIGAKDLVLKNVGFSNASYGIHSNSNHAGIVDYEYPEYLVSKNWILDNCRMNNIGFGLNVSSIDGIIIKNSKITSDISTNDTTHNIYMSINCTNVRVNNCILGYVVGQAVQRFFSLSNKCGDASKNHFYTDLVVNDVDSAMLVGRITDNVMCDSVFTTKACVALKIGAATNVIIANSDFSQTNTGVDYTAFLFVNEACRFWMQNTDVYYIGQHRHSAYLEKHETGNYYTDNYYYNMCRLNSRRRAFIGKDNDVAQYSFKFTGCTMETTQNAAGNNYYFSSFVDRYPIGAKVKVEEYYDKCSILFSTSAEIFRFKAVNDILAGITYRNCYISNVSESRGQPPFIYKCTFPNAMEECENSMCPFQETRGCWFYENGKSYPWLHFENNVYNGFGYGNRNSWYYYLKASMPAESTYTPTTNQMGTFTGAYSTNCYRVYGNSIVDMNDLMANALISNTNS